MPQVDLETLVSACAGVSCDKKIACETLANAINNKNLNHHHQQVSHDDHDHDHQPEIPPDFPPESFWLSKDAEFDWFDRNAFYERKESQKGNNSHSNPNLNPNPSSTSQRFSSTTLKSKASIIGLPKQQPKFDPKTKRNCRTATANWFPKRTASVGKSADGPFCEPSSPKVSCIGRVRSKRDQRRLKKRQGSASESKPDRKPKQKPGFFSSFKTIFRSKKGSECKKRDRRKESADTKSSSGGVQNNHDIRDRLPRSGSHARLDSPPRKSVASEPRRSVDGEPAGLGGMMRFTSGRRSDSWIGDVA